jgi:hypothetical protein
VLPGSIWIRLKLNIYPRRVEGEDHDLREGSEAKTEVKIIQRFVRKLTKPVDMSHATAHGGIYKE